MAETRGRGAGDFLKNPRRRLGQHFLDDTEVAERIAELAIPEGPGVLVEIGPGRGALTAPLLERCARPWGLDAVEIDPILATGLRRRWGENSGLRLHEANALHFDFAALAKLRRKLYLTGNLPYSISTQLVFRLLRLGERLGGMLFMLQAEVALRACAAPGGKTYGRLSVMLQSYCETELLLRVPASSFKPPPRVESAVLRLRPRAPGIRVPAALGELTRRAFSARRKTLRNALRDCCEARDLETAGLDPEARPEQIPVEGWLKLAAHPGKRIEAALRGLPSQP